tara:strand:+ start:1596 stop:2159 length:564 start_codon:yes stop_codon:yes gene_type:complete
MEQQRNKISNRYILNTSLAIDMYNAESVHKIKIDINDKIFYEKEFVKEKEYFLQIEDMFDYVEPGSNTLTITWNGHQDCENKYLKIRKVLINQQHLAPFKIMMNPIENDYIRNLKATDEGLNAFRKQLFNPGYRHGWYGTYTFRFAIDPSGISNASQQALVSATGIRSDYILTDVSKSNHWNRGQNK